MGKTSLATRHKEKHECNSNSELSQHHGDGETSARTRPFSFEEIMRRRKNKELFENVKDEDVESMFKSGDGYVNNACDLSELEKDDKHEKDSSSGTKKHSSREFLKESDGKKQEIELTDSEKYGKQSRGESRETDILEKPLSKQEEITKVEKLAKEKHRENNEVETKWKVENRKDVSSNHKSQSEKQSHDRKVFHGCEKDDFENNTTTNKRSRDITDKDRHESRRRERPEREIKRKYLNRADEKIEDRNSAKRDDFGKGHDFESRRTRDIIGKDRHENRIPEKEIMRKYPYEEDQKIEDRNAAKNHDQGKRRDLENNAATYKGSRDITAKARHEHRRSERPQREIKRKYLGGEDEEIENRNAAKRGDFGKGHDFENRHTRVIIGKDRHETRRERPEKEIKRKYPNEEDQKMEDRSAAKKDVLGKGHDFEASEKDEQDENAKKVHDLKSRRDIQISERKEKQGNNSERKEKRDNNSRRTHDLESGRNLEISKRNDKQDRNFSQTHDQGKRHDLDTSEKKRRKELSRSHDEERRPRQRRSRSREHQDKNRSIHQDKNRSIPLSPRTLKGSSYPGHSGRQHPDSDKRLITRNDSGSHSRRFSGPTSGLGGYSPRKRRNDASNKTPSPTKRSAEKKSARWDLVPPSKTENVFSSSLSNVQSSYQIAPSKIHQAINTVPIPVPYIANKPLNVSVDSVQLTQATRPKRRLYVDNLPDSASEKAFVEFLNMLLLSSGVNHITGTQPCISCNINKEKGQALVEFLTPEDASAALCFDGSSFSGSILKIRRPKDYAQVAVTTVEQDKPKAEPEPNNEAEAAVEVMSDIVKDSPHKIFIGGISTALSSEMLMEIANTFGTLKAYHFEVNEDFHEQCAFLEYVDHSITLKACAALNGMKLGGQVITAVQADPNTLFLENDRDQPFYGIPEHAKPLLKNPTQVLKLKDVLNQEDMSSLSELEVEEVLEDVRIECARFGPVRSVNIVRDSGSPEACEEFDKNLGIVKIDEGDLAEDVVFKNQANCQTADLKDIESLCQENTSDNNHNDIQMKDIIVKNNSTDEPEFNAQEIDGKLLEDSDGNIGVEAKGDMNRIFELGSIFVEFSRTEASCVAAHCLHGRLFDERLVTVEYVALDIYRTRFPN